MSGSHCPCTNIPQKYQLFYIKSTIRQTKLHLIKLKSLNPNLKAYVFQKFSSIKIKFFKKIKLEKEMISVDKISEELKCSICLDFFTNPRTLPCQHSFCEQCLKCTSRSFIQHKF